MNQGSGSSKLLFVMFVMILKASLSVIFFPKVVLAVLAAFLVTPIIIVLVFFALGWIFLIACYPKYYNGTYFRKRAKEILIPYYF